MRRREDELEELLEHGSRNFRRYRRRAYAAFAILALASAFAIWQVGRQADQIQLQRTESIRANCEAQNARHDQTIRNLDTLIEKIPPGERRTRAKTNRAGTVLLIESLAPRQDCEALVARSTRPR